MSVLHEYIAAGLALVPIPKGTKGPTAVAWNHRANAVTDEQGLRRIGGNVGLAHAWCSPLPTCAIDFDQFDKASELLAAHGINATALLAADDAVQIVSGRENRAKLLYRLEVAMPSRKFTDAHGNAVFEFRCADRTGATLQDVLPPSIHPDTGRPYAWGGMGTFGDLPMIPAALLAFWHASLAARAVPGAPDDRGGCELHAADEALLTDLRSALWAISADDRDLWVRVGCALKTLAPEDAARGLWMDWSASSDKFDPADAARVWTSFAPSSTSHRVVFTIAQTNGWANPKRGVVPRASGVSGVGDWPDPKPFAADVLLPVPAFEPNLLPDALRAWVMDEADRIPVAPDFVAASAMVALASVIGARCGIHPKARDPWMVIPNLWGICVGSVSSGKSPSADSALRPLHRLIERAKAEAGDAVAAFEAAEMLHDAQLHSHHSNLKSKGKTAAELQATVREIQALKGAAPTRPVARRYLANDATVETLGELIAENPNGILVFRDELAGLLASFEKQGREGDRAFYLEAANGNRPYFVDRIGRGRIEIANLCVSVLGGMQPDRLRGYLELTAKALGNDGLLQRFQMLTYPDAPPAPYRDRAPDLRAQMRAFEVFDRLSMFDPMALGATMLDEHAKRPSFRFAPDAQEMFIEWWTDLHAVRIPNEADALVQQHLAKYPKLFASLALVCHLVDVAVGAPAGPVSLASAMRAAAWCEYLEAHARRCYGLLRDGGAWSAEALARRLTRGDLHTGFTAADVKRRDWSRLGDAKAVQDALDWLCEDGWLRAIETAPGANGRPTTRYLINPKVRATSEPQV
jgi:hypothetical protein